jgi:hypothetical protein
MATSKSSRQAPPRIFENYVLTRVVSPSVGLTNISEKAFNSFSGSVVDGTNVSNSEADDAVSNLLSIGFDFVFDQKTYKRIIVSTNGWMALADPTVTSSLGVTTQLLLSNSFNNEGINLNNTSNSVLLAPWCDDLKNPESVNIASLGLGSIVNVRTNFGYQAPPLTFNPTKVGVKFFRESNSSEGRRLIIRWNSLSDFVNASTFLEFECVLYENGTIEYRYAPRAGITLLATAAESATIGIFAPGTNRFRDFALGIGYRDGSRQQYRYGGAQYDPNFTDSGINSATGQFVSRPYVWRLKPQTHWVGQSQGGAIFRFSPPQNRRQILPRVLLREQDSRFESKNRFFDDRRSAAFTSGTVVNYPSTLPRFIGDSEPNVVDRQNLFNNSGNELEITGSIIKSAVDQFLDVHDTSVIQPFGEHSRFDQGPGSRNDPFFISGSGIDTGTRLDFPLWSKSQINFSLPVNYQTIAFPQSASIYYYNNRIAAWQIPRNSVPTNGSDIASAINYALNGRIIEDHRGFGPIGNSLSSGSNDPTGTTGTDTTINSSFTVDAATSAMLRQYNKSVSVNNEYEATTDETFTIRVDRPFLIEKAVFEVPLTLGPGWFADKTTSFLPIVPVSGSFDFAGPGLTLALYNQIKVNNHTRRDLIMTGTITHVNDMSASVVLSNFPTLTNDFQLRPVGYLAYADVPGAVVRPQSNNTFTGSVVVKSEALIANGVTMKFSKDMVNEPSSQYSQNRIEILNLISKQQLTVVSSSTSYAEGYNIAYIDSFGRGGSSIDPSPRSILGKEFSTTQGIVSNGNKIANPFYLTGSARAAISASLSSGTRFRATAAIPLASHFRSPYLMLPGDQLVFALAKSRPFFYSSGLGGPEFSGSIAHDVVLASGTINVTLYGSYVKEGREFHDIFTTKLTSDAIHEAIANEPVLDEFEVAYRDEFVGGFSDDFISGTMVTQVASTTQKLVVLTGSRGRVFSEFNARNQATPDTSTAELLANSSKNFRLQPWWERVGTPRVTNHYDDSECFWDSLMPSVADAFAKDGFKIFLSTLRAFVNEPNVATTNVGFVLLDGRAGTTAVNFANLNWARSFPYEPRYSGVSRQKSIQKSFVAKSMATGSGFLVPIDPVQVKGLFIGLMGSIPTNGIPFNEVSWYADVDLVSGLTSSMTLNDTVKVLFGFGDFNNVMIGTDDSHGTIFGERSGTNNFVQTRNVDHPISFFSSPSANRYRFGPIIRGWKYGIRNGLTEFNHATFRRNRYGQNRDMLEQRLFTKFYLESKPGRATSISTSVVVVKFVDTNGNITSPENTQSQNLSFEATSSMPFFDGETRNRPTLNLLTQNSHIVSFQSDQFNNINL